VTSQLRSCPECGGPWPNDLEHRLRGLGWLGTLPRGITPSNGDIFIHDGEHGRDRFLLLEVKSPAEPWPPRNGQARLLTAVAAQPAWTVRVVRGTANDPVVHEVSRGGIAMDGRPTKVSAIRSAVAAFIEATPVPRTTPETMEGPRSAGQNPDGTWGELGWFTEALYREWG
jgi:hypothetical protein